MADAPVFTVTPRIGAAVLGSAETNLSTPAQSSTILTAGADGTEITEILLMASDADLATTTVAGRVYVFLHDGSNYHLYDVLSVTAVGPSSATVTGFRLSTLYDNLFLPTGWSVRCSQSIAGNASILRCIVFGGDF